jgi:hypothetical protein
MNIINRLQQVLIEDRYSRHNINEHIKEDIQEALESYVIAGKKLVKKYLKTRYYDSKFKRLKKMRNDKELDLDKLIMQVFTGVIAHEGAQPIHTIVAIIAAKLTKYYGEESWDGIKTAAEITAVLANTGAYKMIYAANSDTGSIMVESNFKLEEETLQYIANTKYLPPVICQPMRVRHNKAKQYITKRESLILGKGNHHEDCLALDVINIMNSIPLELDVKMLQYLEKPKKALDTNEKKRGFERLRIASRAVYNEMLEWGNKFYFTNKYDKRGRLYSQGHHINIQSTEYKKCIISLHNKELIRLN